MTRIKPDWQDLALGVTAADSSRPYTSPLRLSARMPTPSTACKRRPRDRIRLCLDLFGLSSRRGDHERRVVCHGNDGKTLEQSLG